ncbi:MAG: hypothetical protein ACR2G2_06180 [Pseudonocardia sp.]
MNNNSGRSNTTGEERYEMSTDNQLSKGLTDDRGEEFVMGGLEPRGVFGIYNDLGCAVLGLLLDVVMVAAVAHYWDSGLIPGWLDTHGGRWAWLAAGAAGAVLLADLAAAVIRLDREAGRLLVHRRAARTRAAAAGRGGKR